MRNLLSVLVIVLVFAGSRAQALTIGFGTSLALGPHTVFLGAPPNKLSAPSGTLSLFDPAQGILLGVTLTVVQNSSAFLSAESISFGLGGGTASAEGTVTHDYNAFVGALILSGGPISRTDNFVCSVGFGSCGINFAVTPQPISVIHNVSGADLANFVGTGIFPIFSSLTLGVSGSNLTFAALGGNVLSSSSAIVTYTFIPEPSTALLLSLGLVGLATRRRFANRH